AVVFFFSSRRRHTRFSRDWSSDVCSSDLSAAAQAELDAMLEEANRKLEEASRAARQATEGDGGDAPDPANPDIEALRAVIAGLRSEERRVGKEWRARGAAEP